jgi:LmbE family N-acetylglucosaminyl deacetylase
MDRARRLFVSPHLDDAVFACGQWIVSSRDPAVVTICAGRPRAGAPVTTWDAECGFLDGDDVMTLRRNEDRAALDVLGAAPVWLDFRDDQYGEPGTRDAISGALASVIEREDASAVHFPLGLFHADHERASDAALMLVDRFASLAWHAYEDAIYRRIAGARDARMRALGERGFALERCTPALDADAATRKREAVACYRSQLRALATRSAHDDVHAPEAHWTVSHDGGRR